MRNGRQPTSRIFGSLKRIAFQPRLDESTVSHCECVGKSDLYLSLFLLYELRNESSILVPNIFIFKEVG